MNQERVVAVLSGGSEIVSTSLVEELLNGGFRPAIIAMRHDSILQDLASHLTFKVLTWPPDYLESCASELVEYLRDFGATRERPIPIFATEDGGLRFLLEMREYIEPWGVFGRAHCLQLGGLDKAELFTTLDQLGCAELIAPFRITKTIDEAIDAVVYFSNDAVIKPALKPFSMRMSGMTSKAFMSRDFVNVDIMRKALQQAWPLSQKWIVQQRLMLPPKGETVVWAVRDADGNTYCMAANEVWKQPREGGTGCWVQLAMEPENLFKHTSTILEKINFFGICEIPFLFDKNGQWRMLELNPRPWLQVGLPFRAGVPMVSAVAKILYGEIFSELPTARLCSWVNVERLFLAALSGEQGSRFKALQTAWRAWHDSEAIAIYDTALKGVRRRWIFRLFRETASKVF